MNDFVKQWQRAIGTTVDGQFGPNDLKTSLALLPALPTVNELPWIAGMKSVFGLHEIRDNAKLKQWLRSDGKTLGDPSKLPWCGDGMETAIKNALPNEPFEGDLGLNPYWALNWAEFGRQGYGFGMIGVFKRPSGGHVGTIIAEDETGCYHVLGCNQGDTVSVVRIERDRCVATRWPLTWKQDIMPLPMVSSRHVAKSVNEF